MKSVDEHQRDVLALVGPLAPARVPVAADARQVLAEDLTARVAVPPFDNSAMDGFAVRGADLADLPVLLDVIDDVPAGSTASVGVGPGQAIRIMTGAPIPDGADTVVPVESTDQPRGETPLPDRVEVRSHPGSGRHVRRNGEDISVGEVVLRRGIRTTAMVASSTASIGHGEWLVYPVPRVAVVATGSELVGPGQDLGPGQIPDSNGLLLAGLVEQFGADIAHVHRVADEPAALTALIESLTDVDLIVTTGGVSAGTREVVRIVTEEALEFVSVAMQPGKPQGFGLWPVAGRQIPILALPGNPVSVFVSAWLFVAPLIDRMAGRPDTLAARTFKTAATAGWSTPPGRTQFVPVAIDSEGVRPAHHLRSGSHAVGSLHLADGLAVIPADVEEVKVGDTVEVLRTHD